MKGRIKVTIIGFIFMLVGFVGMPESVPMYGNVAQAAAAKVKISKQKLTLNVGQKKTLKISGTTKKVKWSSNKKSVATVSKKGKVTGKKKGTATIRAKVGKKTYKCKVTVKKKATASTPTGDTNTTMAKAKPIDVNGSVSATLPVGDDHYYKFVVPAGASMKIDIKYTCAAKLAELALHKPGETFRFIGTTMFSALDDYQGKRSGNGTLGVYLNPGTYYIKIQSGTGAGKYSFAMMATKLNNTDLKDSDTKTTAITVGLNQTVTGVITSTAESGDHYKVVVAKAGTLSCTLRYTGSTHWLICSTGDNRSIFSSYSGTSGVAQKVKLNPGTYYLNVSNIKGEYRLTTQFAEE